MLEHGLDLVVHLILVEQYDTLQLEFQQPEFQG